jgi:hypothetical protein
VRIRTRYHWLSLSIGLENLLIGSLMHSKGDPFLSRISWINLGLGALLLVLWLGTYTTLRDGVLTKRLLFIPWKKLSIVEISRVVPHPKSDKWGYGTCLIVITKAGEVLNLQPDHPAPFLTILRQMAPQADFRV